MKNECKYQDYILYLRIKLWFKDNFFFINNIELKSVLNHCTIDIFNQNEDNYNKHDNMML